LAACSPAAGEIEVIEAPSRASWNPEAAYPGFTLINPLFSKKSILVDMSGTEVHSWTTSNSPSAATYLTERGTLLRCLDVDEHPIFRGGGQSGWIEELDWDGELIWEFHWDSETGVNHHDVAELPGGNLLIIAWDRHTREEALAVGRDPELLEGEELWPDAVYEIRPTRPKGGEVVWEWHSWDHLVQNFDADAPNYALPATRPERIDVNGDRNIDPPSEEELAAEQKEMAAMGYAGDDSDDDEEEEDAVADSEEEEEEEELSPEEQAKEASEKALKARIKNADWMHTNGIDYNVALDQIAISIRRYDEIWIIDHSTTSAEAASSSGGRYGKGGDLLYRWGNPFAYGMGDWEDRTLLGQHHVQWIPEGQLGAGGLMVFDNGTKKERAWSVIREWWPARDAQGNYVRQEDQPFGPQEESWTYTAEEPTDFFSTFISGVQRQPSGTTLICSGAQGWVFEVTPGGEVVWDWRNPYGMDLEVDEPRDESDSDITPTAIFRAQRYGSDHPGILALRERGASIPLDPGVGPATNQRIEPEEDEPEEEPEPEEEEEPEKEEEEND
jgi:hypothetical protein